MNSTATNILLHIFGGHMCMFLLGAHPATGVPGHRLHTSSFSEHCQQISKWLHGFTACEGLAATHPRQHLAFPVIFLFSHYGECTVVLLYGFNYRLPDD